MLLGLGWLCLGRGALRGGAVGAPEAGPQGAHGGHGRKLLPPRRLRALTLSLGLLTCPLPSSPPSSRLSSSLCLQPRPLPPPHTPLSSRSVCFHEHFSNASSRQVRAERWVAEAGDAVSPSAAQKQWERVIRGLGAAWGGGTDPTEPREEGTGQLQHKWRGACGQDRPGCQTSKRWRVEGLRRGDLV